VSRFSFIVTLILICLILSSPRELYADITDGLVSAWLFDGNLRDSVGNNDGEFIGGGSTLPGKPSGQSGPVHTADGIISTWRFDGDVKDDANGNDGELMEGKSKPPVKDQPQGKSGPVNIKDGIVSTWKFDGDAEDDIEGNDGDLQGAPLKGGPVYVDGKFGKALKFDGVDDYVQIPDDKSLHLPEGLTIAAWINVTVGGNHAAICWKGEKVGWGANFSWRVCTTSNTSMTWGRCVAGSEKYFATDNVIPATGQWVHVAMTCLAPDAPTNQRAYVNGKDITDVTGQTDNIKAAPPFLVFEGKPVEIGVGRGIDGTVGNDVYFNGLIDEIGIWDRGLNANEIKEVMTKGLPSSRSVNAHSKIATTWGKIKQ
jgi:hypothetical protein